MRVAANLAQRIAPLRYFECVAQRPECATDKMETAGMNINSVSARCKIH